MPYFNPISPHGRRCHAKPQLNSSYQSPHDRVIILKSCQFRSPAVCYLCYGMRCVIVAGEINMASELADFSRITVFQIKYFSSINKGIHTESSIQLERQPESFTEVDRDDGNVLNMAATTRVGIDSN